MTSRAAPFKHLLVKLNNRLATFLCRKQVFLLCLTVKCTDIDLCISTGPAQVCYEYETHLPVQGRVNGRMTSYVTRSPFNIVNDAVLKT